MKRAHPHLRFTVVAMVVGIAAGASLAMAYHMSLRERPKPHIAAMPAPELTRTCTDKTPQCFTVHRLEIDGQQVAIDPVVPSTERGSL